MILLKKAMLDKFVSVRKIFSFLVFGASVFFIVNALVGQNLSAFVSRGFLQSLSLLLVLSILKAITLLINVYVFQLILEYSNNSKISWSDISIIYLKSNITKYIPSNIVPYFSRIFWGDKFGLNKVNISISSFLEVFLGIINTGIVIIFLLITGMARLPKGVSLNLNYTKVALILSVLVVVSVILFLVYFLIQKKRKNYTLSKAIAGLYSRVKNYFSKRFLILYFKLLILVFVFFAISTFIFYYSASTILDYHFKYDDFFNIAICLSLAGYSAILTPGVPGGLGVKESVSVMLILLYGYDKSAIVLAAVLSRVIFILSDLIAYFAVLVFERRKSSTIMRI